MKKNLIKFVFSVFVLVSLISISTKALALTADDISMLLNAGIITQVQATSLTNTISGAATPTDIVSNSESTCVSLQNNMYYRTRDASVNGEVSILQDFLQANNYLSNNPTGFFGLMTSKAVKAFQSANNISPTGGVGPITRAEIASLTCGNVAVSIGTNSVSATPVSTPANTNQIQPIVQNNQTTTSKNISNQNLSTSSTLPSLTPDQINMLLGFRLITQAQAAALNSVSTKSLSTNMTVSDINALLNAGMINQGQAASLLSYRPLSFMTVSSPSQGQNFNAGDTIQIKWSDKNNPSQTVNISLAKVSEYMLDKPYIVSSEYAGVMDVSAKNPDDTKHPNTGSATLVIPNTIEPGNDYVIFVTGSDQDVFGQNEYYSAPFTINNPITTANAGLPLTTYSAEIVGAQSTYAPGQDIKFSIKGLASDGMIGEPNRGFNVQWYIQDQPIVFNSDHNATYNPNTYLWDVVMTAPTDTSKIYTAKAGFYCSNPGLSGGCVRGSANEIDKIFNFNLSPSKYTPTPSMTFLFPNADAINNPGDWMLIQWSSTILGDVTTRLDLVSDNGISRHLTTMTNGSSYYWQVPNDLPAGKYRFLASSDTTYPYSQPIQSVYSNYFTILGTTPTTSILPASITGTNLSVSLSPSSSSGNVLVGSVNVSFAQYTFTNKSATPAIVTGLKLVLQNASVPNQTTVVTDSVGNQTPALLTSTQEGGVYLTNFTVPANSSVTLDVRGNLNPSASVGQKVFVSLTGVTANIPITAVYPLSGNVFTIVSQTSSATANSNIATALNALSEQDIATLIKVLTGK